MKYYILWIQFLQVLLNLSGNEGGSERVEERYELQGISSEITQKTIQPGVSLEQRSPWQDFGEYLQTQDVDILPTTNKDIEENKYRKYMQPEEIDKKTVTNDEKDIESESTNIKPQVMGKDGISTKPAIIESRYPIWRGDIRDYIEPVMHDENERYGDLNVVTLPSIPKVKDDNVVDRHYKLPQESKTQKKMKKTHPLGEKNSDLYNDEYVETPDTMLPSAKVKGFSLDEKTRNLKGGNHLDLKNMLQKEYSIVPATGHKMEEKLERKNINTLNEKKKKPCDVEVKVMPTADQQGISQESEAEELELKLHDPIRTSMRVSRVFSNRRRRKKY